MADTEAEAGGGGEEQPLQVYDSPQEWEPLVERLLGEGRIPVLVVLLTPGCCRSGDLQHYGEWLEGLGEDEYPPGAHLIMVSGPSFKRALSAFTGLSMRYVCVVLVSPQWPSSGPWRSWLEAELEARWPGAPRRKLPWWQQQQQQGGGGGFESEQAAEQWVPCRRAAALPPADWDPAPRVPPPPPPAVACWGPGLPLRDWAAWRDGAGGDPVVLLLVCPDGDRALRQHVVEAVAPHGAPPVLPGVLPSDVIAVAQGASVAAAAERLPGLDDADVAMVLVAASLPSLRRRDALQAAAARWPDARRVHLEMPFEMRGLDGCVLLRTNRLARRG